MSPYINIHTHNITGIETIIEIRNIDVDDIAHVDVSCFYSLGIHPWNLESEKLIDLLSHRLIDSNFLAIGECGLDRACRHDIESQKELFMKHIELSEQYEKPLVIHCVRAYPDIISIRKETKAKQPWIIHGFQGNEQTTEQLLKHEGVYLSLGDVLFKNEEKAKRLLEIIPLNRLFLETDVSERSIVDIYEKASVLSGRSLDDLRRDIFNNFEKIFGKI